MIEIHVPKAIGRTAGFVVGYVTQDLDAVVISEGDSRVYVNFFVFILAGNPRDLAIATERASKLGGVVD